MIWKSHQKICILLLKCTVYLIIYILFCLLSHNDDEKHRCDEPTWVSFKGEMFEFNFFLRWILKRIQRMINISKH